MISKQNYLHQNQRFSFTKSQVRVKWSVLCWFPQSSDLLCLVSSLLLTENARLQEDLAGVDLPHFFYHPTQLWGLDRHHAHLLLRVWRAAVGHREARHEVPGVRGQMSREVPGPPQCRLPAKWVFGLRKPTVCLHPRPPHPWSSTYCMRFLLPHIQRDADGPSSHWVDGISSTPVLFSLVIKHSNQTWRRKGLVHLEDHSLSLREIRMGTQIGPEAESKEECGFLAHSLDYA